MRRVHDLGGKEGYGSIDTRTVIFGTEWEGRMWALAKHVSGPDWTLDWWRHIVERLDPEVYLSIPYFEKWCLTYMNGLISSGVFRADEVVSGHTDTHQEPRPPSGQEGALQRLRANEVFFDRPIDTPPAFAIGDSVLTCPEMTNSHTRLPLYAQDKRGEVVAYHGAHVFPDRSAEGVEEGQHLYTVAFTAQELWGADADSRDSVTLDLWESYFVSE